MAIETLKDINAIGGYDVVFIDKLKDKFPDKFNKSGSMDSEWFEKEIRPKYFIYVRDDVNSISFTLQNGPVKENGLNGCQVDTLIEVAKTILVGLNKNHPCYENVQAIKHLSDALYFLNERTKARVIAGVEGTNRGIGE